jgi:hypothetical protein
MSGLTDPFGDKESLSGEWFIKNDGALEQGDVLFEFPLPAITYDIDSDELGLARATRDVVVVTQTCDIPKPAQTDLLLAVVYSYPEICKSSENFKSKIYRDSLSRGTAISEFALPPKPEGGSDFLVVSFRKLHVVPKDYVQRSKGEHGARLRSPYKEYFAQAYARFTMRVGLPLPLPDIK